MPHYRAPDVYVEETSTGLKAIEAVTTSTACFLDRAERGPTQPTLVFGAAEFRRRFGGVMAPDHYLPDAVRSFFDNGGSRLYVTRVIGAGATQASADVGHCRFIARDPGAWGNHIEIELAQRATDPSTGFAVCQIRISVPETVSPSARSVDRLDEDFRDLSLDSGRSDYFVDVLNAKSELVKVDIAASGAAPDLSPGQAVTLKLSSGSDGDPLRTDDYEGEHVDPSRRHGLAAVARDHGHENLNVYAPGADDGVRRALIAHCERTRYHFAVLDSDAIVHDIYRLDPRAQFESPNAAFYFPWIVVEDRDTGDPKSIPPGGAVCGIYAKTDATRGVHKSPANVVVRGAIDLVADINRQMLGVLNPRSVNVIKRHTGRGIRVWGARTLSMNPEWRYVSVRRLLLSLEASVEYGTLWAVFEPNDRRLWQRLRISIEAFLQRRWREGAFQGQKQADAFYVRVGEDTMAQIDIDEGRLIIEVGIAPVRPAEFVIFRVVHQSGR